MTDAPPSGRSQLAAQIRMPRMSGKLHGNVLPPLRTTFTQEWSRSQVQSSGTGDFVAMTQDMQLLTSHERIDSGHGITTRSETLGGDQMSVSFSNKL